MFIYSFRASTLKFFAVICAALVALIALIAFVPTYAVSPSQPTSANTVAEETQKIVKYDYDNVKSPEDAVKFLSQFGYEVNPEPNATETVTIPSEFDKIFVGYNQIQKSQGLDLSRYKNKTVTRYTFTVKNYPDWDGTVYANVLIYKGRVIGGDICSADVSGFVHGFEKAAE